MGTAFNIIVIILSVFLGIFLLLAIIIMTYAYKLTKKAKKMEAQIQETLNETQSFVKNVKNVATPMIISKLISTNLKNFAKKSKVKVKK